MIEDEIKNGLINCLESMADLQVRTAKLISINKLTIENLDPILKILEFELTTIKNAIELNNLIFERKRRVEDNEN